MSVRRGYIVLKNNPGFLLSLPKVCEITYISIHKLQIQYNIKMISHWKVEGSDRGQLFTGFRNAGRVVSPIPQSHCIKFTIRY